MKILRFATALSFLTFTFATDLAMSETTQTQEESPVVCDLDLIEIIPDEGSSENPSKKEAIIVPRIQNPEVLKTFACVEAELPILEVQQQEALQELVLVIDDLNEEFEAETNFLTSQLSSASPRQTEVFKALLKGLKKRKKAARSAFVGIMWRLRQAEVIVEEETPGQTPEVDRTND